MLERPRDKHSSLFHKMINYVCKSLIISAPGSAVAESLTQNPKVEGSSPATDTSGSIVGRTIDYRSYDQGFESRHCHRDRGKFLKHSKPSGRTVGKAIVYLS